MNIESASESQEKNNLFTHRQDYSCVLYMSITGSANFVLQFNVFQVCSLKHWHKASPTLSVSAMAAEFKPAKTGQNFSRQTRARGRQL